MNINIKIPKELYEQLETLVVRFDENPAKIIQRLFDYHKARESTTGSLSTINKNIVKSNGSSKTMPFRLNPKFIPDDMIAFKVDLLANKKAYIKMYLNDGTNKILEWNASKFSESSHVLGNLRAGQLRDWEKKGIIKVIVAINLDDLPTD